MEIKKIKTLESFQKLLNASPKLVKKNDLSNNLYVPIAEVEKTLDELFAGLWKTINFNYQVVANEIVGSLELQVFHPVAEIWITRTGSAAIQILVKKGEDAIIDNKIKNALKAGFANLPSECLKNAAKKLGNVFGRNLNRTTGVSSNNKLSMLQEKYTLTTDHEAFSKVKDALLNGYSFNQIEQKYIISDEAEKVLKEYIKKNNTKKLQK